VRLQHSNLESITKTKKEDVNDWTGKTHASYSGTRSCKTWGLSNTYSCSEIYIKDKTTRNITVKEITHFPKKEEETSAEVETQVTE
jgi:hypothetical protein